MNGWYGVLCALPFLIPGGAAAADDLAGAARELAAKSAAFAGKGAPVLASWRNLSSLGSTELGRAQAFFEAALEATGAHPLEPPLLVRITVSENTHEYLLIEEVRKGDERQVWFASFARAATPAVAPPAALEKKLLWEQDERILDMALAGDMMLLLTPADLRWFNRQNGQWVRAGSVPLPESRTWPRDPRGRLRVTASAYQAYLPGLACSGSWKPPITLECRDSDEPWVLESGSRAMLLANFAPGRNYFDGHIATQAGERKTSPPFYSAAAATEQGKPVWLLASVDGRVRLYDASFDPVGAIDSWGSDIAGTEARCGDGVQILATRPGEASTDAIQAFSIVNRTAVPLTSPAEFPGPVTALWVSGGTSAVAIARNAATAKYEAYLLTVVCGK